MQTIAVACPLPIESAVFFELPGAPAKERFCIPYVKRSFAGVRLVAATSGMGMTNMAGCVQFLIDSFAPDALIVSGIAGSFNPELGVGDIVLGETLSCLECSRSVIAECAPYAEPCQYNGQRNRRFLCGQHGFRIGLEGILEAAGELLHGICRHAVPDGFVRTEAVVV